MPNIIIKKRGILPPDEHGAEALGLLDEAREEKERVNKNDPRRNPRKPKEWGLPFDKKDNPGSKGYMSAEKLADVSENSNGSLNPVEDERLTEIDKKNELEKKEWAKKVLDFIEKNEGRFAQYRQYFKEQATYLKDKKMLEAKLADNKNVNNPRERVNAEAIQEELDKMRERLVRFKDKLKIDQLSFSQDILKEVISLPPKKLADLKRKLSADVTDLEILERELELVEEEN